LYSYDAVSLILAKKLFHTASIVGEHLETASHYGWKTDVSDFKHDWATIRDNVAQYISSLNFGYRSDLLSLKIKYLNSLGVFLDDHTLELTNAKGEKSKVTARRFLIAVGGRPIYPDIPGAHFGISSDDIFTLATPPGKTLVVGASYVALECAGFLSGLGYDTTVMMRSIPLRGFDQECAEKIVHFMTNKPTRSTKFLRPCVPISIEKTEKGLVVTWENTETKQKTSDVFDTVLFAIGRAPDTTKLGLDKIGCKLAKSGKIIVNEYEQSSVPNVYAIGDVIEGGLELTPVAIAAGKYLADRLYGGKSLKMDYQNVPTTVFTPLEYGACGLPEEKAIEIYGKDKIKVYKKNCNILENKVPEKSDQSFIKLVCLGEEERVVGFHFCGPHAGEVTQGMGIAIRLKARKEDFDHTIGIHPTNAEKFTELEFGVTEDSLC
jgi:thioredoxin/glutathione reductase (selenoprotein)